MTTAIPKVNGRTARVAAAVVAPVERRTPGLMDALGAVQAQAPKLVRDATGQAGPRSYRYVTLDALLDAALPVLAANDLVWVTLPTRDETGEPALRYRLAHTPSGEELGDVMPLCVEKPGPQGQGSAITYARRYAMMAVLGLAAGDDDDGAAATRSTAQAQRPPSTPPSPPPAQPTARPPAPSDRPASAAQKRTLNNRAAVAGIRTHQFANAILLAAGEPERTWESEDAAALTLNRMIDRLPARLVDAVLEGIAQTVNDREPS